MDTNEEITMDDNANEEIGSGAINVAENTTVKVEVCWSEEHGQSVSEHTMEHRAADGNNVEVKPPNNLLAPSHNKSPEATATTPIESVMLQSSPSSFVCQQCNSRLDTFEEFVRHMRTVHLQNGVVNGDSAEMGKNLKFCCAVCGIELPNRMEANMHLMEHYMDSRSRWHCQKCVTKHFRSLNELREHLTHCHMHTLFRCAICLELYMERDEMIEHLMTHSTKEQVFRCVACERDFEDRFGFELHVGQAHGIGRNGASCWRSAVVKKETTNDGTPKSHHKSFQPPVPMPTSAKGLKCVVCDVQCPSELSLDQHRLYEHCKVPQGNRCGVCRSPLNNLEEFMEHSLAHRNPLNEISCLICRQTVRGDIQLEMHGKYHLGLDAKHEGEGETGKKLASPEAITIECQNCKMKVPTEEYARHLLLHVMVGNLNEGTFGMVGTKSSPRGEQQSTGGHGHPSAGIECHCVRCGRTFDSFVQLNTHMLEHLRDKFNIGSNQQIDEGKSSRKQVKKVTSAKHNTRKGPPIRCDRCKQTFISRERFIVHRKRHKMERTATKCRICDQRFASLAQLELHTPIHNANLCKPIEED